MSRKGQAVLLVLAFLASGPVYSQTGIARPVDSMVSFSVTDNVLAGENGTVVTTPAANEKTGQMIDGSPHTGWRSTGPFVEGQSVEIILQLPSRTTLSSLLIQPQGDVPGLASPYELELLTASDAQSQNFESVGTYQMQPGRGWQLIEFTPVDTALLNITIHSVYGTGPVGIGELAAFAPGVNPLAPIYRFTDDTAPGPENFRISLLSAEIDTRIEGMNANPGMLLVAATLEFINTLPRFPITTRVADYTLLLEDGHYVYELDADATTHAPEFYEQYEFMPGVPVTGTVFFEVPEETGHLELVYMLPLGPIRLELTPSIARAPEPEILATSNEDGPLVTFLYGMEGLSQTRGLRLDIGLRLSTPEPSFVWQFQPAERFQLIDRMGRSYTAGGGQKLRRPFGEALVRYNLVSRGEIEFPDAPVSGEYALVLPHEYGHVATYLPDLPPAHLARTREPYQRPDVTSPQAVQPSVQDAPKQTQPEPETRPEIVPASPPPVVSREVKGIPDVLNTGLLSIRGKLLPLYGVEGLYEPHIASFVSYIRDREVECIPEDDESYRCTLEGADLSEVVLRYGAARAKADAPKHLKDAESLARESAKGVWQK